ncbi:VOC family protein [Actinoplanes sp. RD1]|uniref:VOC family protein n=1 Tax=Actinoplanes sp. RD1 TaxID=3064538 RepID=UPI0027409FAB|nr:VOC family protein [Actinoplanes sp. RD1]
MASERLTGQQIADEKLTGWTYFLNRLRTRVATPDFTTGLALVNAIAAEAERRDHHPDLALRYTFVDITLTSYDTGGVTGRDVRLARAISTLIAGAGLAQECASVSLIELGLDTPQAAPLMPFWAAVLGAEVVDGDVRDPHGVLPAVWFQQSGSEEPRQRWHPDIWVDPAQVRPRIDAAVAAGGALVDDSEAPSFWVLADPEGNRVCLCTWQDR